MMTRSSVRALLLAGTGLACLSARADFGGGFGPGAEVRERLYPVDEAAFVIQDNAGRSRDLIRGSQRYGLFPTLARDLQVGVLTWVTGGYVDSHFGTYDALYVYDPNNGDDYPSERFLEDLVRELRLREAVDIFVLAHSNSYYELIARVPAELRPRIRLVYNTGCGDWSDADRWSRLGVGSYVGHEGTSCSPVFMDGFLEAWNRGRTLEESVDFGNDLAESFILESAFGGFCPGATREEAREATRASFVGPGGLTRRHHLREGAR